VLNDPPGQAQQPVDCLLATGATMGSCSYAPTQAQTMVTDKLSSLAQADGVGFLDTWNWFCSDGGCPMVIGRTTAYLDRGHITQVYAAELAGPFAAAFRRVVRQLPS
jgi:hypothetical protein